MPLKLIFFKNLLHLMAVFVFLCGNLVIIIYLAKNCFSWYRMHKTKLCSNNIDFEIAICSGWKNIFFHIFDSLRCMLCKYKCKILFLSYAFNNWNLTKNVLLFKQLFFKWVTYTKKFISYITAEIYVTFVRNVFYSDIFDTAIWQQLVFYRNWCLLPITFHLYSNYL